MPEPQPITPVIPKINLTPKDETIKGGGGITMDFPKAMRAVISRKSIKRISWPEKDYALLKDTWLTIFTKGEFHTWKINDGDMEAKDWITIAEKN